MRRSRSRLDTIEARSPQPAALPKEHPVSEIRVVTVREGQRAERDVTTGTKVWELFRDEPEVIAARVDGDLRDLSDELVDGAEVAPVAIDNDDGRAILRHSTAHVMAQAVQELFPDARLGI